MIHRQSQWHPVNAGGELRICSLSLAIHLGPQTSDQIRKYVNGVSCLDSRRILARTQYVGLTRRLLRCGRLGGV